MNPRGGDGHAPTLQAALALPAAAMLQAADLQAEALLDQAPLATGALRTALYEQSLQVLLG